MQDSTKPRKHTAIMKTRIHNSDAPPGAAWPMLVLCLSTLICQPSTLLSQGTAFTYQGRLNDQGAPASGSYDLTFTLFGTNSGGNASAGPLTNSATILSNGLFTATLDFGSEFDGSAFWLEIAARTNGNGAFSTLSPRQPIMPAPYAVYAANAGNAATAGIAGSANSVAAANLTDTVADSQLSSNIVRLNIPNTTTQATGGGGRHFRVHYWRQCH